MLGLITFVALESDGVALVETKVEGSDEYRQTRIWFVQSDHELLLEAGNPNNPWVRDLSISNTLNLALDGEGNSLEYAFDLRTAPEEHERIRKLMREKYGWRDLWIGMLFDVSASQLVALKPVQK